MSLRAGRMAFSDVGTLVLTKKIHPAHPGGYALPPMFVVCERCLSPVDIVVYPGWLHRSLRSMDSVGFFGQPKTSALPP